MKKILTHCCTAAGLLALLIASTGQAQDAAGAAPVTPLHDGTYIAPMAGYLITKERGLDKNAGAALLNLGYRRDWYALEISGIFARIGADGGAKLNQSGGSLNGLVFPFASSSVPLVQNLYGIAEFGLLQNIGYPTSNAGKQNFQLSTYAGGVGDLLPFTVGRYEFALRAEALYRYGRRASSVNLPNGDIDAPNAFNDILINVGLQLPLGLKPATPPPAPAPVATVPVEAPADADGDGVADSLDQCPGTPAGVKVDDKGCPLVPCKAPAAGEKIDLSGCGTGDVIVLKGVNFEFNKSRLTVNAKTILDDVANALLAQPGLHIEIGGHTDSKGSDDYNQKLSEARAAAVLSYLAGKGVQADHLSAVGYGESKPVADNDTDEGRELNRRVELKILARDEVAAAAPADAAVPAEAATATADSPAAAPAAESGAEAAPAEAVVPAP